MKYFTLIATFILFFATLPKVSAQYGYGYPYGYGYGPAGGVDRTIDRQKNLPRSKKKKDKEEKKEMVDVAVDFYAKELNLDSFQKAAMAKVYRENKDAIESIGNEDTSFDVKKQKSDELAKIIDAKIIPLLSEEQAAKYKVIQDKHRK